MAYNQQIYRNKYISNKNQPGEQMAVDTAKAVAMKISPYAAAGEAVSSLGQMAVGEIFKDSDRSGQVLGASLDAALDPSQYYGKMIGDLAKGENIGKTIGGLALPGLSGIFNYKDEEEEIAKLNEGTNEVFDAANGFDETGGTLLGRFGGTEFENLETTTSAERIPGQEFNAAGAMGAGIQLASAYLGVKENGGSIFSKSVDKTIDVADDTTLQNDIDAWEKTLKNINKMQEPTKGM